MSRGTEVAMHATVKLVVEGPIILAAVLVVCVSRALSISNEEHGKKAGGAVQTE